MMRQQGRDLHAEFLALLPYRLPPVKIQRWSLRRVWVTAFAITCLVLGIVVMAPLLTSPL
jgi:hypothetical protein